MYSVIVGYPSSKKSVLMSLAKDSFNKMYAELTYIATLPHFKYLVCLRQTKVIYS